MLWNGCPQVTRVSQLWSYLSSLKSWKGAFGKHRLGKHRSCKDSNFFWLHRVVAKKDAAKNLSNYKELVGVIHKIFLLKSWPLKFPELSSCSIWEETKPKKKKSSRVIGEGTSHFCLSISESSYFRLPTSDSNFEIMAFLSKAGLKDDAKESEPKERVTCWRYSDCYSRWNGKIG